jgi:hypothetical protein
MTLCRPLQVALTAKDSMTVVLRPQEQSYRWKECDGAGARPEGAIVKQHQTQKLPVHTTYHTPSSGAQLSHFQPHPTTWGWSDAEGLFQSVHTCWKGRAQYPENNIRIFNLGN